LSLTAEWKVLKEFCVEFENTGGTDVTGIPETKCEKTTEDSVKINILGWTPSRPGFDFAGWSLPGGGIASGTVTVSEGDKCGNVVRRVCLGTNWKRQGAGNGMRFEVALSWDQSVDLDSYTNASGFQVYYGNKTYDGTDITAKLDRDITSNSASRTTENTTITTKQGAENVYFSAWVFSSSWWNAGKSISTAGAKVVVKQYDESDNFIGQYNFTATNNNRCWNVFAIKNGTTVINLDQGSNPDSSSICASKTYDLSKFSAKGSS